MTLWTPAEITTALWLDAADETTITLDASNNVDQWNDKSGNDHHATASLTVRPLLVDAALNSNPIVRFSASVNQRVDFGEFDLSYEFTYIVVWAPASGATNKQVLGVHGSSYNYLQYGDDWILGVNSNSIAHASGEFRIKIGSLDSAGGYRWTDGTANTGTPGSSDSSRFKFRYLGLAEYRGPQGDVAEVVICPSIISTADRQKIEGYLAHKWGLEANLPLDHPYKDKAPVLIGGETIEDISLDLSAYYQARNDLAAILSATDGTVLQDLEAFLKVYGQSIEDLPAELAAYYQDRHDIATMLKMFATGYKDLPAALQAMGLGRADLPAQLKTLAWASRDLNTMLAAVTPLVFNDFGLSLSATDGTTINDLSTVLAAVKRAPQYRSVVAQRVRSVISEVI